MISWDVYPTNDSTSTDSAPPASMANFPSMSVTVPRCVPFSTTLTPGRPAPFSSVTRPVTDTSAFRAASGRPASGPGAFPDCSRICPPTSRYEMLCGRNSRFSTSESFRSVAEMLTFRSAWIVLELYTNFTLAISSIRSSSLRSSWLSALIEMEWSSRSCVRTSRAKPTVMARPISRE
ncbi:hypothetical protein D3C87_1575180 [compost metagenome]